ncbi:hypothetical protein Tco_0775620 [Tanacetum coccineum]
MSTEIKLTKDDEADSVDSSKYRAVKRIFRYIRGTSRLGLWYPNGTGIETVVYADSDHAGDYVDRKSTSAVWTIIMENRTIYHGEHHYYGEQYYHGKQLNARKITVVILVRDRCPRGKDNLPRLPIRTNIVRLATASMGVSHAVVGGGGEHVESLGGQGNVVAKFRGGDEAK